MAAYVSTAHAREKAMPPFDEIDCPICGRNLHNHTGLEAFMCTAFFRSANLRKRLLAQIEFANDVREDIERL